MWMVETEGTRERKRESGSCRTSHVTSMIQQLQFSPSSTDSVKLIYLLWAQKGQECLLLKYQPVGCIGEEYKALYPNLQVLSFVSSVFVHILPQKR